MRADSNGYLHDHLHALARRVEVDAKEVRVKSEIWPLQGHGLAALSDRSRRPARYATQPPQLHQTPYNRPSGEL